MYALIKKYIAKGLSANLLGKEGKIWLCTNGRVSRLNTGTTESSFHRKNRKITNGPRVMQTMRLVR